jgi:hypothetical protein
MCKDGFKRKPPCHDTRVAQPGFAHHVQIQTPNFVSKSGESDVWLRYSVAVDARRL